MITSAYYKPLQNIQKMKRNVFEKSITQTNALIISFGGEPVKVVLTLIYQNNRTNLLKRSQQPRNIGPSNCRATLTAQ